MLQPIGTTQERLRGQVVRGWTSKQSGMLVYVVNAVGDSHQELTKVQLRSPACLIEGWPDSLSELVMTPRITLLLKKASTRHPSIRWYRKNNVAVDQPRRQQVVLD